MSKPKTASGVLPLGIEFDGKVHTEFELRSATVGDSVAVMDNPAWARRAEKNSMFFNLAALSMQIIRIGDIPANEITPDLLLKSSTADYNHLLKTQELLEQDSYSFRKPNAKDEKDNSDVGKSGASF